MKRKWSIVIAVATVVAMLAGCAMGEAREEAPELPC